MAEAAAAAAVWSARTEKNEGKINSLQRFISGSVAKEWIFKWFFFSGIVCQRAFLSLRKWTRNTMTSKIRALNRRRRRGPSIDDSDQAICCSRLKWICVAAAEAAMTFVASSSVSVAVRRRQFRTLSGRSRDEIGNRDVKN